MKEYFRIGFINHIHANNAFTCLVNDIGWKLKLVKNYLDPANNDVYTFINIDRDNKIIKLSNNPEPKHTGTKYSNIDDLIVDRSKIKILIPFLRTYCYQEKSMHDFCLCYKPCVNSRICWLDDYKPSMSSYIRTINKTLSPNLMRFLQSFIALYASDSDGCSTIDLYDQHQFMTSTPYIIQNSKFKELFGCLPQDLIKESRSKMTCKEYKDSIERENKSFRDTITIRINNTILTKKEFLQMVDLANIQLAQNNIKFLTNGALMVPTFLYSSVQWKWPVNIMYMELNENFEDINNIGIMHNISVGENDSDTLVYSQFTINIDKDFTITHTTI